MVLNLARTGQAAAYAPGYNYETYLALMKDQQARISAQIVMHEKENKEMRARV
jgi:hypothetical protein